MSEEEEVELVVVAGDDLVVVVVLVLAAVVLVLKGDSQAVLTVSSTSSQVRLCIQWCVSLCVKVM